MPLPTAADVHVDAALTQLSIAYRNPNLIWDRVFPVVPVTKQSDKYFLFDRGDMLRNEAGVRAPGTLANRGGYRLSTDSYFCDNYAFGKQLPDEVLANADAALQIEQADTEYVTDMLQRKLEIQLAATIFTTGVWTTDVTVGTAWSTYATSTPIEDVRAQSRTILQNTGTKPNRLILGKQVWDELQDHPDFLDRLSDKETKMLKLQTVAALLDLEEILVGEASYNTAAEGDTFSGSFVWGNDALLYYAPASAGLRTPSAGYTPRWTGPGVGQQVLRYRDSPAGKKADVIEAHDYIDFIVTSAVCGAFFNNVVS